MIPELWEVLYVLPKPTGIFSSSKLWIVFSSKENEKYLGRIFMNFSDACEYASKQDKKYVSRSSESVFLTAEDLKKCHVVSIETGQKLEKIQTSFLRLWSDLISPVYGSELDQNALESYLSDTSEKLLKLTEAIHTKATNTRL